MHGQIFHQLHPVGIVAVNTDGSRIAVTKDEYVEGCSKITIIDTRTGEIANTLECGLGIVSSVIWHHNGTHLIAISHDEDAFVIWSMETLEITAQFVSDTMFNDVILLPGNRGVCVIGDQYDKVFTEMTLDGDTVSTTLVDTLPSEHIIFGYLLDGDMSVISDRGIASINVFNRVHSRFRVFEAGAMHNLACYDADKFVVTSRPDHSIRVFNRHGDMELEVFCRFTGALLIDHAQRLAVLTGRQIDIYDIQTGSIDEQIYIRFDMGTKTFYQYVNKMFYVTSVIDEHTIAYSTHSHGLTAL